MAKADKKREKLVERISFLENELVEALTKKSSDTKEISVAHQNMLIDEAKHRLINYDKQNEK